MNNIWMYVIIVVFGIISFILGMNYAMKKFSETLSTVIMEFLLNNPDASFEDFVVYIERRNEE